MKEKSAFSIVEGMSSHTLQLIPSRFDYTSPHEPGGQLVRCTSGELELYGHAGEWAIPADHMVYIPDGRWFRLRARVPSGAIIMKFCRREVLWRHDGCWVGQVDDFARHITDYALKWTEDSARGNRKAAAFFVTLGEMVPGWFCNERIMWTPYAQNSSIQKVVDFANRQGPSITLGEAASHAGMSERTLRRRMQVELGQTWRDFIRELRMKRAMDLLRKERKSIIETAFEVGFSSSSAFSHAFAEYVGKTPSAYARSFSDRSSASIAH
ncbi:helix-turn-helix transcriptional regulator [Agrobacterium genomosp. 3]|uniref:helix-turn-helix transcriptional regulator n=1 Tax=Agrobacterium tomkonis TaxID=1183410 RepID=UPI001CD8A37A|nr:helix-turn-helix transcriptional regulator [Agrobacterium tomkonis]MCA1879656.1 helix-turn-helix transcriptional regulator [Agrobacterium tumefaciens]MCA1894889.1 helix-turn-helix transcriptional regulator [Agrobacterium tomkonis]